MRIEENRREGRVRTRQSEEEKRLFWCRKIYNLDLERGDGGGEDCQIFHRGGVVGIGVGGLDFEIVAEAGNGCGFAGLSGGQDGWWCGYGEEERGGGEEEKVEVEVTVAGGHFLLAATQQ